MHTASQPQWQIDDRIKSRIALRINKANARENRRRVRRVSYIDEE